MQTNTAPSPSAAPCKIVVAYDSPAVFLRNRTLLPLHIGRSLTDLDFGLPGDDTGENISHRHSLYAELTATYWAWKNLPGCEHVGLFPSGELLDLSLGSGDRGTGAAPVAPDEWILKLALDEPSIAERCRQSDILTAASPPDVNGTKSSVYSRFVARHPEEDLHLLCEVFRRRYPAEAASLSRLLSGTERHLTNAVVMRAGLFQDYCAWMFDLLAEVEAYTNPYELRFQQYGRNAGLFSWFGRLLTTYFILKTKSAGAVVEMCPTFALAPNGRPSSVGLKSSLRKASPLPHFRCPLSREDDRKEPLVSVVMPVYNGADFLLPTIESVQNQTLKAIELIVVDDGSRDGSLTLLRELARRDPRISVLTQKNLGPGLARQFGLERARGEFVHFMDCDDLMEPHFLELLCGKGRRYEADIVVSSSRFFDSTTELVLADVSLPHTVLAAECTNVAALPDLMLLPGHLWDKLFRRDFAARFPFSREGGEDLYFFWRAIASAERVAITKEIYFNYRVKPQSVQSNSAYALSVSHTLRLVSDDLGGHPRSTIVLPYLPILVRVLIPYMLRRNAAALDTDATYRRQFHEMMTSALDLVGHVHPSLAHKCSFLGEDCGRIDDLASLPDEIWWEEVPSTIFGTGVGRWTSPLTFYVKSLISLDRAIALYTRNGVAPPTATDRVQDESHFSVDNPPGDSLDVSPLNFLLEARRALSQMKQSMVDRSEIMNRQRGVFGMLREEIGPFRLARRVVRRLRADIDRLLVWTRRRLG